MLTAIRAIRDVFAPAPEPVWDAFGHTVLCAFVRVAELEAEPRKQGGAGVKQTRERIEAKARARELLAEWGRRLDANDGDRVTMSSDVVPATEACKPERSVKATSNSVGTDRHRASARLGWCPTASRPT
jgi:hypothetical protein